MGATAASEHLLTAIAVVGIAAEDRQARMRLAGALAGEPDLRIRAGTSAKALIAADAADDLLVLHLQSVDPDAVALVADLRRQATELPIVVVCESTDRRSARRVVDTGVEGLVYAEHLTRALAPTVAAVLAGQTVVPRMLGTAASPPLLTVREKQILGMVVMGFTNSEIASRLFVAESTVKSHLSASFRKLGVQSRSQAAALILDPHGSLGPGILAITGGD